MRTKFFFIYFADFGVTEFFIKIFCLYLSGKLDMMRTKFKCFFFKYDDNLTAERLTSVYKTRCKAVSSMSSNSYSKPCSSTKTDCLIAFASGLLVSPFDSIYFINSPLIFLLYHTYCIKTSEILKIRKIFKKNLKCCN